MIENLSDLFSVLILISIPLVTCIGFLMYILSKRKKRKKEEVGKYYPEW